MNTQIKSIQRKFRTPIQKKSSGLLNIYFTAGYPRLHTTQDTLLGLQNAGADMIEVGVPYSDPLADGPTIQQSSSRALLNGMTLDILFGQLAEIRDQIRIPVYLMCYWNQCLQYGMSSFCEQAKNSGITGLIIPDLPIEYFDDSLNVCLQAHHLKISFLITPETSEDRIRLVDRATTGFVYMVSQSATTGKSSAFTDGQRAYFDRIKNMGLKNQRLIGFGIHDHNTYQEACRYADGAIIGSAFIRHISEIYSSTSIRQFVNQIKNNTP